MAVTLKGLAENCFAEAVRLEKDKKAQGAQDYDEAFEQYKQAITYDPTHAGALNNLACLYLELKSNNLERMEENRSIAKDYLEEAVKLGHIDAKRNLQLLNMVILSELIKEFKYHGDCYEKGIEEHNIPNPDKAIEMYENAMATCERLIKILDDELANGAYAPKKYRQMVIDNKQGIEMNKAKLLNRILRNKLYQAALDSENGEGPERRRNDKSAIKRYEMAIKRGHTGAMMNRALMYEEGVENRDVPEYDKAIALYNMAKQHRDADADVQLQRLSAELFKKARKLCGENKIKDAITLYEYAAKSGGKDAMVALGLLYETGDANSGEPDYEKAMAWYEVAIEHGSTLAMVNSAHLHETGYANNGIPDYKQAISLYEKARDCGDKRAEGKLLVLERKIKSKTPDEKKEGSQADKENIEAPQNGMIPSAVFSGDTFFSVKSRKRLHEGGNAFPFKKPRIAVAAINI